MFARRHPIQSHCLYGTGVFLTFTVVYAFFLSAFDETGGGCLFRGVTSFAPTAVAVVPRKNDRLHRQRKRKRAIATTLHIARDGTESTTGSRYVCLLEDYKKTMGPYFFALFDQLIEQTGHEKKHVAFLTAQKDLDELLSANNEKDTDNINTGALESLLETMESSLDLDGPPEVFVLEDWNPMALEERFSSFKGVDSEPRNMDPTIVWLYGKHNAFYTRHLLRTSGFDRWIEEHCASSSVSPPGFDNCVFVGEGTGALCAGDTMDAPKARGNDPRGAPELQVYGLKLLGEDDGKGVVFVGKEEEEEDNGNSISELYPRIEVCREDEVFVWAQPHTIKDPEEEQVATKFVMAPNRRGTIERYETCNPLPPLIIRTKAVKDTEGVACYGEPSVDPSRSAQAVTIGDSEWWE